MNHHHQKQFRYEFSHASRRMWRKNRGRSPNLLLSTFGLCKGTDLNRNFPTFWGEDVTNFTWFDGSRLSCVETYIGEHQSSEPETKAIIDFVAQHKEELSVILLLFLCDNVSTLIIPGICFYSQFWQCGGLPGQLLR